MRTVEGSTQADAVSVPMIAFNREQYLAESIETGRRSTACRGASSRF